MNKFTVEVQENDAGELFIEFPDQVMEQVGWKEGDTIKWVDNKDGSFTLQKPEKTEWVLVEAVGQFRIRYMVEVPEGHADYALDTVSLGKAKEFSQSHLGETIVSHRVMTQEDAVKLCREDHDYLQSWPDDLFVKNNFTTIAEQGAPGTGTREWYTRD